MHRRSFLRPCPSSPSSHASCGDFGQITKDVLKTNLKREERALDEIFIHGGKGTISTLFKAIAGLKVGRWFSQLQLQFVDLLLCAENGTKLGRYTNFSFNSVSSQTPLSKLFRVTDYLKYLQT